MIVDTLFRVLKHNYSSLLLIVTSIRFDQFQDPDSPWELIPEMLVIYMSIPIILLMLFWILRTINQWAYAVVHGDEQDLSHSFTAFSGLKTSPLALLYNVFLILKVTISIVILLITGLFYKELYNEHTKLNNPFFWVYGINELMWLLYLVLTKPHKSIYLNRINIINQLLIFIYWIFVSSRDNIGGDLYFFIFTSLFPFGFVIGLINYLVEKIIERRKQKKRMDIKMNRQHDKGGFFIIDEFSTDSDYYFSNRLRKAKLKIS